VYGPLPMNCAACRTGPGAGISGKLIRTDEHTQMHDRHIVRRHLDCAQRLLRKFTALRPRGRECKVDSSRFSPDEFPVICPRCGYELHPTASCCSECGVSCDRDRLLVQLYVTEWGWRLWRRSAWGRVYRLCRVAFVVCLFILAGIYVGALLARYWRAAQACDRGLEKLINESYVPIVALIALLCLCLLVQLAIVVTYACAYARRRRMVMSAMKAG